MEKAGKNMTSKQPLQQNEYEQQRLMRIQSNKCKMQSLGIKRITASLTSLVDSEKVKKKRKKNQNVIEEDKDYIPTSGDEEQDMNTLEDEYEKENDFSTSKQIQRCPSKGISKRGQFIPPMSVAKFLNMNKKQQQAMVGDKTFNSLSKAMKVLEQAISNHEQLNVDQENTVSNEDMQDIEGDAEELNGNAGGVEVNDDITNEEDRRTRMDSTPEDESSHDANDEIDGDRMLALVEGAVKGKRGPVKGKRGPVKGKRGPVRNRAVIPVQVEGWTEIKSEKIEHLWSCVLEKCSFDDPELRKDSVIQHARRLFRDSRHKLKHQYYDDPKLKTKEDRVRNKPEKMTKGDWKYLVDFWSGDKFKAKSAKATESRAHQKMPHYNGTKSFARAKDEYDCSRVDLLIESRKRKSKKSVNAITLANNINAVSEMKKLTEERQQGLNTTQMNKYLRRCLPSRINLAHEVIEVRKTAEQAILEARKDAEDATNAREEAKLAKKEAENAREEAKLAKKEAAAARDEIDQKIAANNKLWEKRLRNILQGAGLYASENNDPESTGSSS
ncbi:uncharacterized protein [Spinacia oleracea]|uniref:Transposase, Ptta/En/Spm, plant n=1 Tax=Spinacia oleracea TaxID=3562 RepID=A0ABM3RQZ6_SPIOL|nr:uncharacterized protein LOC130471759 [Spinacia oleracea]